MIVGSYDKILDKISRASGVEKEELERRVEAKRAKFSGLISKEGAAQIVASELGISFDNENLKIDELMSGMKKVNTTGKVISLFPVREFERNGKKNKVANIVIADETANIKVVLWDTNHISLIEEGRVGEGSVIEIANASMRDNELHLGSFSEMKLSTLSIENVKTEVSYKTKPIVELKSGDKSRIRAFIVQMFDPRFFEVCPECSKKVTSSVEGSVCEAHGKVIPEKRFLINGVVDDGTENIRVIFFNEGAEGLGIANVFDSNFADEKSRLLGKEMFFSGSVRQNKLFNNLEIVVDQSKEIDLRELIKELEA